MHRAVSVARGFGNTGFHELPAIVQTCMQCLYADEVVTVNRSTAEASKARRDRAAAMWLAGSISKVDFAQLESQYVSDEYQVVVARTSLDFLAAHSLLL